MSRPKKDIKKEAKITFMLDSAMRKTLEKEATEKDVSVSWVIVHRLRKSLETDQCLLSQKEVNHVQETI